MAFKVIKASFRFSYQSLFFRGSALKFNLPLRSGDSIQSYYHPTFVIVNFSKPGDPWKTSKSAMCSTQTNAENHSKKTKVTMDTNKVLLFEFHSWELV